MDGFWLVDADGRLLEVNDAYCRMSGYSSAELLGMRITDLEALESEEQMRAHVAHIMAVGQDRFETRHRRKDGTPLLVEITSHTLDFGVGLHAGPAVIGEVTGFMAIAVAGAYISRVVP